MSKHAFRPNRARTTPAYPDLDRFEVDRGRRTCLTRLGAAAGAILLALGGAAEAGELPGKKEKDKGKKKKKEQPKPPPARPGGPAYPPAQLDSREEEMLGQGPKKDKKKDGKKKDGKKEKRPVLPPPGVPPQPRSQLDELLE